MRLLGALAVAASLLASMGPQAPVANPVQQENALPGTAGWLYPVAADRAVEGYADAVSALPGDTVGLHVSTAPAARYRVEVYRLGWYAGLGARRVACLPSCTGDEAGRPQAVPAPDPATGLLRAGWATTDRLAVGHDWVSGYYLVDFRLTSGPQAGHASLTYLIVRAPPGREARAVVQVPVNTWQAYNAWGGRSLYESNSGGAERANHVSFDRPYAWEPLPGGQPLAWELPLVRFLERQGVDLAYQTDVDTQRDPRSLLRHRLVVVAGHDEYWTKELRDAFNAARDAGTNLAFLGANDAYWQMRYEDGGRTIVTYKSRYDPQPDPALKTTMFRDLEPPRYECELIGVQHQGVGLTWQPGDYVVAPTAAGDPWLQGTGLVPGAVLRGLVSVETDTIPGNQTAASSCGHALTVFFHHETGSDKSGNADATRYTAPSGARVFASGSHQFSWGLDDLAGNPDEQHGLVSAGLQRFMQNALADLLRPAPLVQLAPVVRGGAVTLLVRLGPDPRIRSVDVVRLPGRVPVCTTLRRSCVDRPPAGRYRYAAVERDRWGASLPVVTPAVLVAP